MGRVVFSKRLGQRLVSRLFRERGATMLPVVVMESVEPRTLLSDYTMTTLASFYGTNGGPTPAGNVVVDVAGDVFGATSGGGTYGDGTIFEIAAGSQSVTTLASFENATTGSSPSDLAIDASGNIFGVTQHGGAGNNGEVFEISAGASTITPLASLSAFGAQANGDVILDGNGNLYGTTDNSVFELPAGSNTVITVATLSTSPSPGLSVDTQGNIFGTTPSGGMYNDGTVFEISAGSSMATTLISFDDADLQNGSSPKGYLTLDSNGNIFGTTEWGGANDAGTAFEIQAGSTSITTLVAFASDNGETAGANGGLIIDQNGNIFGTTQYGGGDNDGTVFEIPASSGTVITLYSFEYGDDGAYPQSGLASDATGNLYGATLFGGSNGNGTVFEYIPTDSTFTTIAAMPEETPLSLPTSWRNNFVVDQTGNLFGITDPGGDNGGAIVELKAGTDTISPLVNLNGDYTTIGSFDVGGTLTVDSAGNVFGATASGGPNYDGTLFEIPAGTNTITPLASFDSSTTGSDATSLIVDSHGNVFGATSSGGANSDGTIFELAAGSNTITPLASYSSSNYGGIQNIAIDGQGDIFGETWENNTIVELPAGSSTINTIATLDSNSPAGYLPEGLVSDSNGNIFGVTAEGGANNEGAIFEIPSGTNTLSPVAAFDFSSTGGNAYAGLTIDSRGNLFGTTDSNGQLWELSAGSDAIESLFALSSISGSSEGDSFPVVAGPNGNIYGLTPSGDYDGGALVEFSPALGPPAQLTIDTQPTTATAGSALGPMSVEVDDANGNLESADTSSITVSLAHAPENAHLAGTLTVPVVNGVATFSNLSLTTAGSYTLTFTDTDNGAVLTPATSDSFAIIPSAATKLAFTVEPTTGTAGQSLSDISVAVEDQYGNVVATNTSAITLNGPSNVGLTGTLTKNANNGIVTFSDVSLTKAGSYSFSATDGSLASATSDDFTVVPAAAAKLTITAPPTNAIAGTTLSALTVAVKDAYGNIATTDTSQITVAIASGPSGATVGGTATLAAQNGLVSFGTLSLTKAGAYTLSISDGSLTGTSSDSFTISPAAPVSLVISQQPTNGTAGQAMPTVAVEVEDKYGNPVDGSSVSLAIASGPAGSVLGGTTILATSDGMTNFTNLTLNRAGTYTLSASDGTLPSVTTTSFVVTYVSPQLVFATGLGNAMAGKKFSTITIDTDDIDGNLTATGTSKITVSLSSGDKLLGTTTALVKNGVATFKNFSIQKAGTYTLTASDASFASAVSNQFIITAAAAKKITFEALPANITHGTPFSVDVQLIDRYGNLVSDDSTVALGLNSHPKGTILGGVTTASVNDGNADFDAVILDAAGKYTLKASDGKLKVTSPRFEVS